MSITPTSMAAPTPEDQTSATQKPYLRLHGRFRFTDDRRREPAAHDLDATVSLARRSQRVCRESAPRPVLRIQVEVGILR
jgi:hypothetical protein